MYLPAIFMLPPVQRSLHRFFESSTTIVVILFEYLSFDFSFVLEDGPSLLFYQREKNSRLLHDKSHSYCTIKIRWISGRSACPAFRLMLSPRCVPASALQKTTCRVTYGWKIGS
jgi:hypothetical protein